MTNYDITEHLFRIIVLMRAKGVTVRAMAKCFGMSKSTMGRWVQQMDTLSHLGQLDAFFASISTMDQPPSVPNAPAPLDDA
jgi:hypothetical protein